MDNTLHTNTNGSAKDRSQRWLILTLLLSAAITLLVQIPLLADPLYVDEDLRFFYWLHRLADPSLFAVDPLLGYQIAEVNLGFATFLINKISLLYGILYSLLSPWLSPFTFSKLLLFPLALIASYYLFRIGERVSGAVTAFLLCVAFTLIVTVPYSSISVSSGLPRAFTMPVLLAALYYMMANNFGAMTVVLVLSLFYPPAFLTILLTYGVKITFESFQNRRLTLTRQQTIMLSLAVMFAVLLSLPATMTGLNTVPESTGQTEQANVISSPLFGSEGRYSLFEPHILTGNGGVFDNGVIGLYSFLFVHLLIVIALVLRRRMNWLSPSFHYLVVGGVIGFSLSWLAILFTPSASLHMPSRYTQGSFFIVSLVAFTINAPAAIHTGAGYLAKRRGNLEPLAVRSSLVLQAMVLILVIVLVYPISIYGRAPHRYYRPKGQLAELVDFIETLPQDSVIAGYPCYLDDVPLFSRRAVLFSCETESRDMDLMKATLSAYFAESEEEVLAFCRQYNVNYMVASQETFTTATTRQDFEIFEPLRSYLRLELRERETFAVAQIPDHKKIFQNSSYFVFACRDDTFATAR